MKASDVIKNKGKQVKEVLTIDEHEIELSDRAMEIDVKVQADELKEIISALKATMERKNITALSAPAIGYKRRVFCIKFDTEIKTFVNPVIAQVNGMELSYETCTSIPGKKYVRLRNPDIMVIYQRPTGTPETRQMIGVAAKIFQHEIDHLDGLLLSDVGLEIDEEFEKATDEERQEVINWYLEALDIKAKELKNEIENDPELKQIDDAVKFMTSVYKGETKIE